MSKREALARALYKWGQGDWSRVGGGAWWRDADETVRAAHFRGVDAFLAELREPDEAMIDSGRAAMPVERDTLGECAHPGGVLKAMLDTLK